MSKAQVPNEHHIARHVKNAEVHDGRVTSDRFKLKPTDNGELSVYEPEHFSGDLSKSLVEIKNALNKAQKEGRVGGRKVTAGHSFAVTNVGAGIAAVQEVGVEITVSRDPVDGADFHAVVEKLPEQAELAEFAGIKLAYCCTVHAVAKMPDSASDG